jgi:hypothetical protein
MQDREKFEIVALVRLIKSMCTACDTLFVAADFVATTYVTPRMDAT